MCIYDLNSDRLRARFTMLFTADHLYCIEINIEIQLIMDSYRHTEQLYLNVLLPLYSLWILI